MGLWGAPCGLTDGPAPGEATDGTLEDGEPVSPTEAASGAAEIGFADGEEGATCGATGLVAMVAPAELVALVTVDVDALAEAEFTWTGTGTPITRSSVS